jgi:hypothetical protein
MPTEGIPKPGSVLDSGYYLLRTHLTPDETAAGKFMIKGDFTVVEPVECEGRHYFENFVIGTNDDLDAADPQTWKTSVGARIFNNVLDMTGIVKTDDVEKNCDLADGQLVTGRIIQKVDPEKNKDGTPNQYAGTIRNSCVRYYRPGSQVPRIEADPKAASQPTAGSREAATEAKSGNGAVPGEWEICGKCKADGRDVRYKYKDGGAFILANERAEHLREVHPELAEG